MHPMPMCACTQTRALLAKRTCMLRFCDEMAKFFLHSVMNVFSLSTHKGYKMFLSVAVPGVEISSVNNALLVNIT